MVRSQYAATPTPSPATLTKGAGSITSASAGTKYVWLYCRCRAGVTLFSESRSITLVAGDRLNITLPSLIQKPGSDIFEVGIAVGTDSNPANACVLASYPMYDALGVANPLPATIALATDEQFKAFATVPNTGALPTGSNLVHGMRRYIDAEAKIKAYDANTSQWKTVFPQNFNPYLSDSQDAGGCDRPISDIADTSVILTESYAGDNSLSKGIKFWIVNDTSIDIAVKTKIRISTSLGELDPDELKGLLKLTFLGHVNLTTGAMDTSMFSGSPPTYTYQGDQLTNLQTKAALPPGWAYVLQIQAQFSDAHLDNRLPQGETIYFYPRFGINQSTFNPAGKALGNYIAPTGRRRRILPNGIGLTGAIAADGEGCVAEYNFEDAGEVMVPGLLANTADQFVLITNTGACYAALGIPSDTAALRAVVSTVDGIGPITDWSGPIALNSTKTLKLTLSHPSQIRGNYPDVVAGMNAVLNSHKIRVFVRQTGTTTPIQVFDVATVGDNGEDVFIAGTPTSTIASLPTVASNFGLFTPNVPVLASQNGASSFSTNNFDVAIAYVFENALTVIDHDYDTPAAQTIVEMTGTVEQLFRAKANGELNGPAGPTGATGPQGATGPAGPQGPAGGAAFVRATVTATTATLAPGATDTLTIPLGKSFQLLSMSTDNPAWVRLYTTTAKRTADTRTNPAQSPTNAEHGVITDDLTSASALAIDYMSRGLFIFGASMESTPSANISMKVTNTDTSNSRAITVNFTRIEREV